MLFPVESSAFKRWLWIAVALLMGGLLLLIDRSNPRVDGARLSVWFERSLLQNHSVAPSQDAEPFRRSGRLGAKWLAKQLHPPRPLWSRAHEFVFLRFGRWIHMPPPAVHLSGPRTRLARQLIGHLDPKIAAPVLIDRFKSCRLEDKSNLAEALGELGPDAAEWVGPCLVSALESTHSEALAGAILALGEVLYQPEVVVPKLVPFLAHPDTLVRTEASYTLGNYRTNSALAREALMEALDDSHDVVRANAARALGRMGPDARPAVEPLLNALRGKSSHDPIVARAQEALSAIAPEVLRTNRSEMEPWGATSVPYFDVMVATARARLGKEHSSLTDQCLGLADNFMAYMRWEALERLGESGDGRDAVRAVLVQRLSDPNGLVRQTAREALERWCRRHAPAGSLESERPSIRAEE